MRTKSRHIRSLDVARPVEGEFRLPGGQGSEDLRSTRGVVFVEYVALLLLVTVGGAAAVLAVGAPLVTLFRYQQLILSLPIP